MITFEEALRRLSESEGLDRGSAVSRLLEASKAGDPEVNEISDLSSALNAERAKSVGARFGAGLVSGAVGPFEDVARAGRRLFGAQPYQTYSEELQQKVEQQYEPTPYVGGVGELVGSALPWEVTESALARGVPFFARHALIRRAAAGAALGGLQTGTAKGAEAGAVAGAVIPPVIEAAAGLVGAGVRGLFGREVEVPHPAEVPPEQPAPKAATGPLTGSPFTSPEVTWRGPVATVRKPPPEPGVPTPSPETAAEAGMRTLLGPPREVPSEQPSTLEAAAGVFRAPPEAAPETPAFLKTAEQVLEERRAERENYVGSVGARTGQPFVGERTRLLETTRGRVYVNENHPAADVGTPGRVEVANPMVLNVHDDPYGDALEQVFPNNAGLHELHKTTETPNDLAREVLGRFATRKGFDSVILRAPDPANDIILDYKGFEKSPYPGLGRGEAGRVTLAEPSKTIFARVAPEEKPTAAQTSQEVAVTHGFRDEAEMATAIRASRMSPWEAFRASGKMYKAPLPDIAFGGKIVSPQDVESTLPDTFAALQAVADRRPYLMNRVKSIAIMTHPKPYKETMALTWVDDEGFIRMSLNADYDPTSIKGKRAMEALGFTDPREYMATTLEHELTHVAQYWADARGLGKTFGVPSMEEEGITEAHPVERQAYDRDVKLKQFFDEHRALQARVDAIPEEVRARLAREEAAKSERIMRPIVSRKYNKLKGEATTLIWAKKAPKMIPDDMDAFDSDSRSLFDSQFDPDEMLDPWSREYIERADRYGLKWFSSFRRPIAVTDDPRWQHFVAAVNDAARERSAVTDRFNRHAAAIFKNHDITEANHDAVWEAVEGLRGGVDGSLTQTLPNVDPKINAAALDIRRRIYDPAYEYHYKIDRRGPAIMEQFGLPQTKEEWWRIKLIQEGQHYNVKNPTMDEFRAAQQLDGMLHFDEGTDLSGTFKDGYLPNEPIANEQAVIMDQIAQLKAIGSPNSADLDVLQKRLARLTEIRVKITNQKIRSLPPRDVVPKKVFWGPVSIRDHPGAAEVLVDKNLPHITGRYISGLTSKVFQDKVLFEFNKISKELAPTVRDYGVNYVNNMRGVRGYREDIGIVNMVNAVNKLIGRSAKQITIREVRDATRAAMGFNNFTKLYMNQVRFPIIQAAHIMLTSFVADPGATVKGLAYFMANPKRAYLEAVAAGVLERDNEFLGALDDISPSTQGRIAKLLTASTHFSDVFRKAVTYHGFTLRGMEPDFAPSKLAKGFERVPGENTIQYARRYGAHMTDLLQFRLRVEGKPQAFVGGMPRRLWGQFKQWPINIGGLYADILKSRDPKMIARMAGMLWFFGGMSLGTGEIVTHGLTGKDPGPASTVPRILFDGVRGELLRHGYVLPKDTGWQFIANQIGIGDTLQNVEIASLHDPLGAPRSLEDLPSWAAGPTFGALLDYGRTITQGDPGNQVKATLSAVSPQLRAGLDAVEELRHGGVLDPRGRALAMRNPSAIAIRGFDLSPSVRTLRWQYKNDLITAYTSGQPEVARQLLEESRRRGIIWSHRDVAAIKAVVKKQLKQRAIIGANPESLIE